MFRMILFTQWMWSRTVLLFAALGAFALPILSVQRGDPAAQVRGGTQEYLLALQAIGVGYPLLAAAVGLLLALTAWTPDHRGRHIYALTLPVPRWHYALLRFSAGLTLLFIPVAALWIAALLATSVAAIPIGLAAYPTALALRFALATVVAYTIFSAIAAGTSRTAGYVLGVLVALLATQLLFSLTGSDTNIVGSVLDGIFTWPGPLQVFSGRWMLIDV